MRPKWGWAGADRGENEGPHTVTALAQSGKQRYWDVQGGKRISTELFLVSFFGSYLLQHLPCTCSPIEHRWHDRLSPPILVRGQAGEAWGMEKHLPALQKGLGSGISSDKYFPCKNLFNTAKRNLYLLRIAPVLRKMTVFCVAATKP